MTNEKIDIRITKARSALIMQHPFFGSLSMRLIAREHPGVETMLTDSKFLYYSRKALDSWTEAVILFIVAHEVLHCALGHCFRRGSRDHGLWNRACDYVVNSLLKKAGFKVPDWALHDPAFDNMGVEQIYRILQQQKQEEQPEPEQDTQEPDEGDGDEGSGNSDPDNNPNDGNEASDDGADGGDGEEQDGDGEEGEGEGSDGVGASTEATGKSDPSSGKGGGSSRPDGLQPSPEAGDGSNSGPSDTLPKSQGDPGRAGEVMDAAPQYDQASLDAAADEWSVFTRQAASVAKRANEGRLPGWAEEIVQVVRDPHTDWRTVLRRFIDPSTTQDYSWRMPSRRMMAQGYFVPGLVTDGVHKVAFLIDTSGSVNTELLEQFGAEAQAALDDGGIDQVVVVFADTQVNGHAEYTRGELIDWTVLGRGGTRFAPTFEWLNENHPDVTAAVYLSDLECSDFGLAPVYPVLWAGYAHPWANFEQLAKQVPFGEVIEAKN